MFDLGFSFFHDYVIFSFQFVSFSKKQIKRIIRIYDQSRSDILGEQFRVGHLEHTGSRILLYKNEKDLENL